MAKSTPKKKSNGGFIAIIAIVLVAGGAWIFTSMKQGAPTVTELPAGAPLPEAKGHVIGKPDAPFTITEFADFECPGCGQFAALQEPDLRKRIVEAGLANFRFMDFPLGGAHQNSLAAHLAASCAEEQGKFWEMHDQLFAGQYDWNTQATSSPRKVFDSYAQQLGLDMAKFGACFDSQRPLAQIQANKNEGERVGVTGTPTIVINNRMINPTPNVDGMIKILDSLKAAGAGAAPTAAAPTADTSKK